MILIACSDPPYESGFTLFVEWKLQVQMTEHSEILETDAFYMHFLSVNEVKLAAFWKKSITVPVSYLEIWAPKIYLFPD